VRWQARSWCVINLVLFLGGLFLFTFLFIRAAPFHSITGGVFDCLLMADSTIRDDLSG